ncbi:hypothetical protein ACS5NO_22510 [Larkinella sp. GY13]|jgi:hypothetical protein|uniref:hypothetical protein n=1 Tax=unclassified Larkinella TaxID=2620233 RepID=UPI001110FC8B|nr:hypothetical protein [Larkinella sp. C7]
MNKIEMEYMYRDAGNNKLRHRVVFENKNNLTIRQIRDLMQVVFIDKLWFDPDRCGVKRLNFKRFDSELDHLWHEIEWIGITTKRKTSDVDIADFLFNSLKGNQFYKLEKDELEEYAFEP